MDTRKKILVIDDEEINLEFFEVMLTKLGFEVEKAGDGEAGLAKAKKFFPDLIMLDNIMPKMSGWELTRILKADSRLQGIPIIMLSALDDVKDKIEGFELGIDDYITKPFNFSEVLARIRAVLRNRELFTQIAIRETRLSLVEEFTIDIKNNVLEFIQHIDDLEATMGRIDTGTLSAEMAALLGNAKQRNLQARKSMADLDARIDKTRAEWENLKKNEIGLTILEKQIRQSLQVEG
ncbi:MAG: response regulator [Spirochaetaceae bacterium]|jgi:DNA-binding response OmpR family regulator|nr:response regulator [Spirochaetaceae bacterium]